MTKNIEREAFETWFKTTGMYEALIEYIATHQPNLKSAFIKTDKSYRNTMVNTAWLSWQAAKSHEAENLKGCVVVPVELSEYIAEKLALGKVEKPRQENDVVWQEIADRAYRDRLLQKKWEIIRDYKELVEAARGGNE